MDGKYIFALVILGLFFLLILISFAFLEYLRKKDEKLQAWINDWYANNDLNKPDYDNITAEEEIPVQSVQETVYEAVDTNEETEEDDLPNLDEAYGKIDVEGIEEITGNYDGSK